VLLPLVFNNGAPVPESLLVDTLKELRQRFGAVSWETQLVRGVWESSGRIYHDNLTRMFVDIDDRPEHREFFESFKEKLKARFGQLDVWITSHSIDVI